MWNKACTAFAQAAVSPAEARLKMTKMEHLNAALKRRTTRAKHSTEFFSNL
jgi:hypothetical protein